MEGCEEGWGRQALQSVWGAVAGDSIDYWVEGLDFFLGQGILVLLALGYPDMLVHGVEVVLLISHDTNGLWHRNVRILLNQGIIIAASGSRSGNSTSCHSFITTSDL